MKYKVLSSSDVKVVLELELVENEVLWAVLEEIFEKEGVFPFHKPRVEETEPGKFKVSFPPKPSIKVPNYKELVMESPDVPEVQEKELDMAFNMMVHNFAESTPVDRVAKKGDMLVLTLIGTDEAGNPQVKAENQRFFMGIGMLLPKIEGHFIGLKEGEKTEFDDEVRGMKLHFVATVNEVHELKLPDVNQAFAAKVMNDKKSTLDDVKKSISLDMLDERKMAARRQMQDKLMKQLVEGSSVELSQEIVDGEIELTKQHLQQKAEEKGLKVDEMFSPEDLEKRAKYNLTLGLALDEILKDPVFSVSDEELMGFIEKELEGQSPENQVKVHEELKKNPSLLANMRRERQMQKFFKVILG